MRSNKLITKTVLLSVAMAGVITSCQKDEFQSEMVLPSHEMSQKLLAHQELTLRYWIDGVEHNQEYASQQELISRYGQEQVINQAFEEEGF
jgi:hypothetical protein